MFGVIVNLTLLCASSKALILNLTSLIFASPLIPVNKFVNDDSVVIDTIPGIGIASFNPVTAYLKI